MMEIERPKIETANLSPDGRYGKFVVEPLERGFGTTLGNSLRRVLLSSLPGVAVTSVKIDGVVHEFSTIEGVREDVTEIVLNLKGVAAKIYGESPKTVRVEAVGPCEVTAGSIKAGDDLEILNPEWHIATLGEGAKLVMELTFDKGRGYVPAEKNKQALIEKNDISTLPVDSIYTPVLKANYTVDRTRVGQITDYDLVIAVGTRFSDRVALNPDAFAKRAKIIQIDIDPSELGKNVDIDLSLTGDASYVLQAILPHVKEAKHADWMDQIHAWQAMDYKPVDSDTELKPHQIINEICEQAGPEAVYVTDVGQHQMWAAQYLHHTKSRGFLTSGGLGTMGFGYGAAIGAQMALGRDARVVMLTGDGSFHMNLNEGCTAVSYDLPIITVIFNNQVLGMVRQWQTTFYEKRYSDTDPHRKTDFVKLAEAFGAKGYRATTPAEFKVAFTDAMKQQGPSWIDCRIGKDEKVLPMIPGGGTIEDIIME